MRTEAEVCLIRQTIEQTEVQPYTTKDLARIFNMSSRTFRRNIAGIKEKLGRKWKGYFYSVEQVVMIFEHMGGAPYKIITVIKEVPLEMPLNRNVSVTKVVTMTDYNKAA